MQVDLKRESTISVAHLYGVATRMLAELPAWLTSLGILIVAIIIGLVVQRLLYAALTRLAASRDLFWRSLVPRTRRPALFTFVIIAIFVAARIAPLTPHQTATITHVLLICLICLAGWITKTTLYIWTTLYLRRFKLDAPDNLLARKHVTQSRILLKVADLMIVVVAVAVAMMTFPAVRQYGISLLAAGGAAGIVVGLALQPMLKNVFAGIQLAVTQPIRIDDALIVEGEWGRVEEITSTYVVLKIWDWRRMILPLSYFIEHPFQNWTRESASLIGTVLIYLDYSVPVDAIRAEAERIARASPLWDHDVINVAVTDFRESTMEIRILASATDSGRAFDLRCEVREKLVAFVQREYPSALPHLRTEFKRADSPPSGDSEAGRLAAKAPELDNGRK